MGTTGQREPLVSEVFRQAFMLFFFRFEDWDAALESVGLLDAGSR